MKGARKRPCKTTSKTTFDFLSFLRSKSGCRHHQYIRADKTRAAAAAFGSTPVSSSRMLGTLLFHHRPLHRFWASSPSSSFFCFARRLSLLLLLHCFSATTTHSMILKTTTAATTTTTRSSPIRAILFDMDGTLLDTEVLSDKAILQALPLTHETLLEKKLVPEWRIPWAAKKPTLGLGGTDWIPGILSYARAHWNVTDADCPTLHEFWEKWETGLNGMCHEIEACPGATALVEQLARQEEKIPMAIATSSRYEAVRKKRQRHDAIFQHLDAIVARDDPAIQNGKPAPDLYLEAARRLNVDPQHCLVFEDALSGVRAGKAAGCAVVAIPDPRFTEQEKDVFRREADLVVDSLSDFDGSQFGLTVDMRKLNSSVQN